MKPRTRRSRLVRGCGLCVATLLALGAPVLWIHSYVGYINLDFGLWHRAPGELTSKEGTVFTFRGGVGVMLRRRAITLVPTQATQLGWEAPGPSLHIGPAIDRSEYAIGEAVFDVAGVYVGHSDGPHNGISEPSRVVDHVITLPLWLVTLACAIWPIRALLRWRRERHGTGFEIVPAATERAAATSA